MNEHASLLSRVELFGPLPPERLERIAPAIPAKDFGIGEHVFTSAYRGEMFFLLLEGRVRIYRLKAAKEATLGVLEAGALFGEAAFTKRGEGSAWAQAIAPSRVAILQRSTFYNLVRGEPEVGIKAIELLSERLSFYEQRISDLSLKHVPARLAGVILELAEQAGVATGDGGYHILTRCTHEQLASMIGAKRVAVSRAMKGLREAGVVQSGRGRSIVVKDAEALRRIANEAA